MVEKTKPNIEIIGDKQILKKVFDRVEALIPEIKLQIKKEGITVREVDPSHVVLYEATIDKKVFSKYKVNIDTEIGIDVERIKKPLMLIDKEWVIHYDGSSYITTNNRHKTGLIDIHGLPNVKKPNIKSHIEIKTDKTGLIKKMITIGSSISDYITFYVEKDKQMWLKVEGDTDRLNEPLGKIRELQKPEYPVKAMYSVDYLSDIFKDLSNEVVLQFSTDNPLTVIEEREGEKHTFLLAPRLEG